MRFDTDHYKVNKLGLTIKIKRFGKETLKMCFFGDFSAPVCDIVSAWFVSKQYEKILKIMTTGLLQRKLPNEFANDLC